MSEPHEVMSAFAERLKNALTRKGIPAERGRAAKIGRAINVSHVTVKKWLDGDSLPDQKHMIALATWLEVSFDWLATGMGQMEVIKLKQDEMTLIARFRQMDRRGQQTVITMVEQQAAYAM